MSEVVNKATDAAKDKTSEVASGVSYEANKSAAKDSDRSVGDRVSHATDAVKDKVDEKKAEASKEANKSGAENEAKSIVETIKEKAAEALNFVSDGTKGFAETVKEKAAESYNFVAEKVSEATHAVTGDKPNEKASAEKAEANK